MLIRVSPTMNRCEKGNESRVVRVPLGKRLEMKWNVGDFINLEGKDGRFVTLQVEEAEWSEVFCDEHSLYVNQRTFDRLNVENINKTEEIEPVTGITVGCDPEVFIANNRNEIQPACLFFPKKYGAIGFDGWMVEFRPNPSEKLTTLLNNIGLLIAEASKSIESNPKGQNCRLIGMSYAAGATAGFHIHFGLPYRQLLGYNFMARSVASQIVRVLDYYVGIPCIIPEGQADSGRRTYTLLDYGKPGNFRLDNRTLEYRVPGGHMIRHPKLTIGMLAIALITVQDVVSRISVVSDNLMNLTEVNTYEQMREMYNHLPSAEEITATIVSENVDKAKGHMAKIKRDYKGMVGYEKNKELVEMFLKILEDNETFSENIAENWRAFYYEEQQRPVVLRETSGQTET